MRSPGGRKAKFKTASKKGTFLGYMPNTTRNILWFDSETNRVKISSHVCFDEGMNDLPIDKIPPNVQHLQCSEFGRTFEEEKDEVTVNM